MQECSKLSSGSVPAGSSLHFQKIVPDDIFSGMIFRRNRKITVEAGKRYLCETWTNVIYFNDVERAVREIFLSNFCTRIRNIAPHGNIVSELQTILYFNGTRCKAGYKRYEVPIKRLTMFYNKSIHGFVYPCKFLLVAYKEHATRDYIRTGDSLKARRK